MLGGFQQQAFVECWIKICFKFSWRKSQSQIYAILPSIRNFFLICDIYFYLCFVFPFLPFLEKDASMFCAVTNETFCCFLKENKDWKFIKIHLNWMSYFRFHLGWWINVENFSCDVKMQKLFSCQYFVLNKEKF